MKALLFVLERKCIKRWKRTTINITFMHIKAIRKYYFLKLFAASRKLLFFTVH